MHKIERDIRASHFILRYHLSHSILSMEKYSVPKEVVSKRCSISFLGISIPGLSSMRHGDITPRRGSLRVVSFAKSRFHVSTMIGSRVTPTSTTRSRSTLVNARYRGRQSRVVGRIARYCFTSNRIESRRCHTVWIRTWFHDYRSIARVPTRHSARKRSCEVPTSAKLYDSFMAQRRR